MTTSDELPATAQQACDGTLRIIETRVLNGTTLSTADAIALAQAYATRALTEPPPDMGGGADVAAFLRGIDPKELERVVLERDDLHDGLTGPMLEQLAAWAEGR